MAIGQVKTGMATSLKLGAEDAGKLAKVEVEKGIQTAAAMKPKVGQIKYIKQGEPVFNCFSNMGKQIEFIGGAYLIDKKDPIATDIIESLQHFVDTGLLVKEEGSSD